MRALRILIVTPRLPYPLDKGDRLTVYHLLRCFSQRHRLALACFSEPDQDPAGIEQVAPFCERVEIVPLRRLRAVGRVASGLLGSTPLQLLYYTDPRMRRAVERMVAEFQPDVLYGQLIRSGPYIEPYAQIPRVLAMNLSMTLNYRRLAEHATDLGRRLFYALEHRKLQRFESGFARRFDRVLLISEHDRDAVSPDAPLPNSCLLPHGVDVEYFRPEPGVTPEPDSLIMTGNMSYVPNAHGARTFCQEVLPRVRARVPGARLSIVGADPRPEVAALAREPGVTVTGRVEDLRPPMRRAQVAVAPVQIAAGLQNKVLEGMSMALPMVITPAANEGIGAVDGRHVVVADKAERFADAIVELFADPAERRRLGRAARELVLREWSWETHFAVLEDIFQELAALRAPRRDARGTGPA